MLLYVVRNSITIHSLFQRYQSLSDYEAHNRLDKAEATVAQKLNQASSPEKGLYIPARRRLGFRVCFFGSFLHYLSRLGGKQKRTIIQNLMKQYYSTLVTIIKRL
jgi:hypothetical protein